MIKKLAHVGIAVRDLDASAALFARLFGAEPSGRETVGDVLLAFFRIGGTDIELTQPAAAGSALERFLGNRGEGIHHLSFDVDDIRSELARLTEAGFVVAGEAPRPGADGSLVAFLHPKSTNGVLIELCQSAGAGREK